MTNVEAVRFFFQENRDRDDLAGQAVRSGIIALVGRGAIAVVQMATTLALARLLVPADFGLVAIVAALTGFAPMLIDLGLTDSTVQNRTITPAQISALFWFSVILAAVIGLVLFLLSSLLASTYGHPEIEGIASAWGITLFLYGLSLQHMALLRRALHFAEIARVEIVGAVVGASVTVA